MKIDILERDLTSLTITNINPTFHRQGRLLNQVPLLLKTKFFFFKFQNNPLECFTENIMIIAQKK